MISDEIDQQGEIGNIKKALSYCGYPDWSFKLVEEGQKEGKTKKMKVEKEKKSLEGKGKPGLAVLLYVKELSEAAARVLAEHGTSSVFIPANTISQHLFRLKDKKG